MKIKFSEKETPKEILRVSISSKNENELIREGGIKTLSIKSDKEVTLRKFYMLLRKIVAQAKSAKAQKISFHANDLVFKKLKLSDQELGRIIGSELSFANYEFDKYKTTQKESQKIKEVVIAGASSELKKGINEGLKIAEEVNATRTLSNTPGGDMTPRVLAQAAKKALSGTKAKLKVLGEKEMKAQKMHAILSVGQGSKEESKFIIMEYFGGKKDEAPVVLVGKGVTFDTGGINLKPSGGLLGMNMDMSGGAAVIHTMALVAKMGLKKNVIGLVPSVENMASGSSYRPGDVIKSMSGLTIEVLNTDAEGRVIMADALHYAKKYKPALVADVATLTGAAVVALGERASAFFTKNDTLAKDIMNLAEKTNDHMWQLPLWEEYEEEIKGRLGDYTNMHKNDSRYGGAILAATFLHQFIKDYNWVHFDIAPRMTAIAGENLSPGALGAPVRLLYSLIENY